MPTPPRHPRYVSDAARRSGPPYGADFSQSGGGYRSHDHKGYPDGRGERRLGRPEGDWDRPHPGADWPTQARPGRRPADAPYRGPRVQRPDARVREDIAERLTADPLVDATDIEIECSNGVVTLTGLVDRRRIRQRVEDLAAAVPGVVDVANRLSLKEHP